MMQTLRAVIHDGKIELAEPASLPEGAKALVTLLPEDEGFLTDPEEREAWSRLGRLSLAKAYGDDEPDYSEADLKPELDR